MCAGAATRVNPRSERGIYQGRWFYTGILMRSIPTSRTFKAERKHSTGIVPSINTNLCSCLGLFIKMCQKMGNSIKLTNNNIIITGYDVL